MALQEGLRFNPERDKQERRLTGVGGLPARWDGVSGVGLGRLMEKDGRTRGRRCENG